MEIFKLFGSILVNNDEANKSISKTDEKAEGLSQKFASGAKVVGKWAAVVGAAALGVATAVGVKAFNAAADFEKQMANVATLLDGDVKTKIANLGTNVKALANTTGVSTQLLTDGLYQVVSAFGDTADSMNILEVASKGAKAGNATVTDSVNLLSAVTKGYGDTSSEAAKKASDLAFLTVKLGQTDFPSLASAMGKVIPLASTMKVSQEELFGAMATLTGVTGGTAEVTTQLRATIQGFLQPSKEMQSSLRKMGYENGQAALESEGLGGVLNKLKDSVGGNEIAFSALFSSVEAKNAVLALTGAQAENFTQKTEAMKNAVGATEEAFEKQQATVSAMMERLETSFNVVLVSLGEKLLPIFQKFLNWILKHMPEIQTVLEKVFKATEVAIEACVGAIKSLKAFFEEYWFILQPILAGITAGALVFGVYTLAINAAAIATGIWATVTGIATAAGTAFGVVLAFITSPIGLVVIAIGLLVAAGVLLYKNWDVVKAFAEETWNNIWEKISGVIEKIKSGFSTVKTFVLNIWDGIVVGVKGYVNKYIDALNLLIKGLNKIKFSAPDWVPVIGGKSWGVNIPEIPKLAKGGNIGDDGAVMVGEKGPEILSNIKGAKVTPLDKAGGGITVNITGNTIMNDRDADRFGELIVKRLRMLGVT